MADEPNQIDTITPFKGAAEKQTLPQRIEDAVANLADITVATLVTNVTVGVDERGRLDKVTTPAGEIPAIITNVNLIDGNVTTVVGTDIKDDAALAAFHGGLVEQAVKVLPANITGLVNLVKGLFK